MPVSICIVLPIVLFMDQKVRIRNSEACDVCKAIVRIFLCEEQRLMMYVSQ